MAAIDARVRKLRSGGEVVVRTAEAADAPGLLAAILEYVADNDGVVWAPGEFAKSEADVRAWIEELAAAPAGLFLVAELGGEVIGNIDFRPGDRRRIAHVGEFGMGVRPAFRGRGVGRLLLEALLDWADAHPALEMVRLRAISRNERATALYRACGFVEDGRRARQFKFEDGGYADDVLMSRPCRPGPGP